jgi:hypothetical protein
MGWGQKNRSVVRQSFAMQHQAFAELQGQRQILGGQHGQGCPEAVDPDL